MKNSTFPFVLAALTGLAGCSSRAGTEYKGEPLLRVTGKVVMQNDSSSDLVPALAYWQLDTTDFRLVDVDVTGKFPAGFTLDIFEPPPDDALFWPAGENVYPDPRVAFAYITAVPADHPDLLEQVIHSEGVSVCFPGCPADEPTCVSTPSQLCGRDDTWCNSDRSSCYTEISDCTPDGNCVVTSTTGDSKLKNHWGRFPGLSQNYFLLYLENDASENTAMAFEFGGRKPMSRGYHLIEISERTPEEVAAGRACEQGVTEEAIARYNAEHGTAYTSWADIPEAATDVRADLKLMEFRVLTDRNCYPSRIEFKPVQSSADHPVTIQINPDARPIDVLPGG